MIYNLNLVKKFCLKYKIKLLIVFGSYACGEMKKTSDIDLAFFSKTNPKEKYLDMLDELSIIFENEKIDLINLCENDNILLKKEIVKNGKIVYGDKKLFDILYANYISEYLDFKENQNLFDDEIKFLMSKI